MNGKLHLSKYGRGGAILEASVENQFSRRQFLTTAVIAAQAQTTKSKSRPNILFLMSDSHRYNAMGCAGNPIIQTPNFDRLAQQSVRFANTYCQGPLCQPSRASILTGQYVHQHRLTWNAMNMDPEWPTMMKQFQSAGYYTALIGKDHFGGAGIAGERPGSDLRGGSPWVRRFGLDYVLEEYDKVVHNHPGMVTLYTEYLRSKNLLDDYLSQLPGHLPGVDPKEAYIKGIVSKLPQQDMQTSFLGDHAVKWLRNYSMDKPFFLWVSFVDPHPPEIDDAKWAQKYRGLRMPVGPVVMPDLPDNAYGKYMRDWIKNTGTMDFTPERAAEMARHYYGMTSLVDQKIGDILAALREKGEDKNTWIVYTSDHGEMLGDHKMVFKNVFYKGSVRVPNIVRPPGGVKPRTVNGLTQSIDLTATMLDIAGTELPGCKGRSLRPMIYGEAPGREVVYSELAGHQNKGNFFVMAATERYRYLYDKQNDIACELFDLEKDPDELQNLVDEPGHAGVLRDMHKDYVQPFMAS